MKERVLLVCFLILFVGGFAFAQDNKEKKDNKETVIFYVEGMNCRNCQAKVEKNIAFEKGVTDISCNLSEKLVTVTYRTDKTTPEKIAKGFAKIKMPAVVVEPDEENLEVKN